MTNRCTKCKKTFKSDCNIKFSEFIINEIRKYKQIESETDHDKYLMLYGHNAALKKGYNSIKHTSKTIFEEDIT